MACKRGSPLILGVKESHSAMERRTSFNRLVDADETRWRAAALECWVASDASALLEHTKKCARGAPAPPTPTPTLWRRSAAKPATHNQSHNQTHNQTHNNNPPTPLPLHQPNNAAAARVVVLEDNDVLHIAGGGFGIYNTAQSDVEEAVPRLLQTLQMEARAFCHLGEGGRRGGACWGGAAL